MPKVDSSIRKVLSANQSIENFISERGASCTSELISVNGHLYRVHVKLADVVQKVIRAELIDGIMKQTHKNEFKFSAEKVGLIVNDLYFKRHGAIREALVKRPLAEVITIPDGAKITYPEAPKYVAPKARMCIKGLSLHEQYLLEHGRLEELRALQNSQK